MKRRSDRKCPESCRVRRACQRVRSVRLTGSATGLAPMFRVKQHRRMSAAPIARAARRPDCVLVRSVDTATRRTLHVKRAVSQRPHCPVPDVGEGQARCQRICTTPYVLCARQTTSTCAIPHASAPGSVMMVCRETSFDILACASVVDGATGAEQHPTPLLSGPQMSRFPWNSATSSSSPTTHRDTRHVAGLDPGSEHVRDGGPRPVLHARRARASGGFPVKPGGDRAERKPSEDARDGHSTEGSGMRPREDAEPSLRPANGGSREAASCRGIHVKP